MMHRTSAVPAICVFLFALAGCHHETKGVQQTAVSSAPAIAPIMVSVPPPTHHDQLQVVVEPVPTPVTPPELTRRVARTPRKTSSGPATPATPPQTATLTSPVELGALSAGGETSTGFKQRTADLLKSQQQRLAALGRADAAAHPTEIAQVKAFLQKASNSWDAADYEGAHTLVVKAKVLLDDLHR